MIKIWFWQNIVSPHVASLVTELAKRGVDLTYVAEIPMSDDRIMQGWNTPQMEKVQLLYVQSRKEVLSLISKAPKDVIHISAGLRSIGIVRFAQEELRLLNRKQWVLMESISNKGFKGFLRRFFYKRLVNKKFQTLQGILAIGSQTKAWLMEIGFPKEKIYSFAYFLPDLSKVELDKSNIKKINRFRFIFVGQFIKRKNLKLLIDSLMKVKHRDFELIVVGSGELETNLHNYAKSNLPNNLSWMGVLPQIEVMNSIRQADCLVLPSLFDGWGAVVAEALIVGTPAICSEKCGVSNLIEASRVGGIFKNNDQEGLTKLLNRQIEEGLIRGKKRDAIAKWAVSLHANMGAKYLHEIIEYSENKSKSRPDDFLRQRTNN
jgi:glycosyltransferase involved in cell wall biosynthesis